MKKRHLVVLFSVFAMLLIMAWLVHRPKTRPVEQETSGLADSQDHVVDVSPTAGAGLPSKDGILISNLPPGVPVRFRSGIRADLIERAFDDWRTPINFYGKVVDENDNPVEGATINFGWTDLSLEGYSRATTTSDANGLFSLEGRTGKHLSVHVSKDGYYTSRSNVDSFFYAGENENFVPDRNKPVIFRLRKKGNMEKLIIMKRNYRVARDGAPLSINLETGNTTTAQDAHFVVQCWTDDRGKRSGEKYDWRCLVTVPGGGLVLTNEEFPFLAPETGYKPTAEIDMPADRTNWSSDVDLKFYYRLVDGRYGRMTFSMIAGGDHFCMIESFLNPSGSRNLEPKQ